MSASQTNSPAPLPENSFLIRTGFLFGKPAIYISRNAKKWRLLSTHASVHIRDKVFYSITQENETTAAL